MTRSFLPLYLFVLFVGFLGLSIALPIFPPFFLDSSSKMLPSIYSPSNRVILLGIMLSLYPLGQLFGAPLFGKLSDQIGRKKTLILSLICTGVAYLMCGVATQFYSYFLLIFSRILLGVTSGALAISQAAISEISKPQKKSAHFGYVYGTISIAFVIGPLIGGQLAKISYSSAFYLISVATFVSLSLIFFFLPQDEKIEKKEVVLPLHVEKRSLRPLFLRNFLIYFALFSYFRFYVIHFTKAFHFDSQMLALIISFCALFTAAIQLIGIKPLMKRFSTHAILVVSSFCFFISLILLSFAPKALLLWFILPFCAIIAGLLLTIPALSISNMAGKKHLGKAMGENHSIQVFAETISGFAGAMLIAYFSALPLIIGSLSAFAAGIFALRMKEIKIFAKENQSGHAPK